MATTNEWPYDGQIDFSICPILVDIIPETYNLLIPIFFTRITLQLHCNQVIHCFRAQASLLWPFGQLDKQTQLDSTRNVFTSTQTHSASVLNKLPRQFLILSVWSFSETFRAHFNARRWLGLIFILSVCVKKFMPHIERQLYDVWPKPILRTTTAPVRESY